MPLGAIELDYKAFKNIFKMLLRGGEGGGGAGGDGEGIGGGEDGAVGSVAQSQFHDGILNFFVVSELAGGLAA